MSLLTSLVFWGCSSSPFLLGVSMYLLYADESGSISDPSQRHFVLAGVAVFEREPHWIEQELNEIAARFDPGQPHLELFTIF
jgi:hypothetical protein